MAVGTSNAKQYKVLVSTGKVENNQVLDIAQSAGDRGQPMRIKAQAGVKYQLQEVDRAKSAAPDYVKARRVGKDLHITFEEGSATDLIIEDYYTVMPEGYNAVIGKAENGAFYEYVPEDPTVKGMIPELAEGGQPVNVALGGQEVQGAGAALAVLAFNPLLAALGLAGAGAAVAAAGGGAAAAAAAAVTGVLAATSDTGTKGDNITQSKNPSVTGKAAPGSAVSISLAGPNGTTTSSYTAVADANGDYNITVPANLADGTYTPKITVTPTGGAATTIDGTPFTVDNVTNVAITSAGTANTNSALTGTAEPSDIVVLKDVNGQVIGSATASSTGAWSITPSTPVPAGTVTATATDRAGNTATGAGTPATLTGALASTSDSGTQGDNRTNDKTPDITGSAPVGSTVSVTLTGPNGATTGPFTAVADASGKYNFNVPTNLVDATYTPVITVTPVGGVAGIPTSGTPFTVDTVTNVVITSPGLANTTSPLTGTAEPGDIVTLKDVNGQVIGSTTATNTGAWTVTPTTPLTPGKIIAAVIDASGNTASAVPPVITLFDAKDDNGNGIPTLSGHVDTPNAVVTLKDPSGTIYTTTADASGNFSLELPAAPSPLLGTYTATAKDAAGNVSAPVTTVEADLTAPVITLFDAKDDNGNGIPTLSGHVDTPNAVVTLKDPSGTRATWEKAQYSTDGGTTWLSPSGSWFMATGLGTIMPTSLPTVTTTYSFRVIDEAGNVSSVVTKTFTPSALTTAAATAGTFTVPSVGDGSTVIGSVSDDIFVLNQSGITNYLSQSTAYVEGHSGNDTLRLTGAGTSLNLLNYMNDYTLNKIHGMEFIDMSTDTGAQTLIGNAQAFASLTKAAWLNNINLASGNYQMVIKGTSADTLVLGKGDGFDTTGFTKTGTSASAANTGAAYDDGIAYDIWTDSVLKVQLLVQQGIVVTSETNTTNVAPALADTVLNLAGLAQNAATPTGAVGTLVSTLVGGITDSFAASQKGIAITGVNTTNGTLYYSTDGGTNWTAVTGASDTNALLLAADGDNRVYFKPNASYTGLVADAMTLRAWDRTSGADGAYFSTTPNGTTTAFSTATDTVAAQVGSPAIALSAVGTSVNGFVINGQAAGDGTIYGNGEGSMSSVANAGDINGDGYEDLIVSAEFATANGLSKAGRYYVVFGKPGATSVDLSAIAPATGVGTGGFVINGASTNDGAGSLFLSSVGDLNGDGLADLVLGARYADTTVGVDAGAAYVVYGKTGTAAVDLSNLGAQGFTMNGEQGVTSVSGAGDVNGDGLNDFVVGALNVGGAYGRAYVVFGSANMTSFNLSTMMSAGSTTGFVVNASPANMALGTSVSNAGDVTS